MWTGLQADYDLRLVCYEKSRIIEREGSTPFHVGECNGVSRGLG